jgi:drug/metabolite transporter (DMT)-like permease
MMLSASLTGELLAIAALVMFSVNVIITKVASTKTSLTLGFLISVSMNVIVCGVLFGTQWMLREDPLRWNAYGFGIFLLAGVFSTFMGRWFFYESVVHLGPAKASVFQISSPLFAAIIAWLFLNEQLTSGRIVGMAITVLGLLVVIDVPGMLRRRGSNMAAAPALQPGGTATGAGARAALLKRLVESGMFLGIAGSLAYAVGIVLRSAAVHSWNEPILGTLLGASSGVMLHMLFSSGTKDIVREIRLADRTGVLLFMATGVLTILAQMCTIASLIYVPVSVTALITLCTPALVFPMSYFLLKNQEKITIHTVLGSVLTLAGIVAVVRP